MEKPLIDNPSKEDGKEDGIEHEKESVKDTTTAENGNTVVATSDKLNETNTNYSTSDFKYLHKDPKIDE